MLRQHLGIGWAELRDDLLGDAVVLAYRPGRRQASRSKSRACYWFAPATPRF